MTLCVQNVSVVGCSSQTLYFCCSETRSNTYTPVLSPYVTARKLLCYLIWCLFVCTLFWWYSITVLTTIVLSVSDRHTTSWRNTGKVISEALWPATNSHVYIICIWLLCSATSVFHLQRDLISYSKCLRIGKRLISKSTLLWSIDLSPFHGWNLLPCMEKGILSVMW